MREFWRRLKYLFHRDERAQELDEEMRTHLAMRSARLREQVGDVMYDGMLHYKGKASRAALDAAREVQRWQHLPVLLRRWSLRAAAYE